MIEVAVLKQCKPLGKQAGKNTIVKGIHKTTIASKFIDIDISICH